MAPSGDLEQSHSVTQSGTYIFFVYSQEPFQGSWPWLSLSHLSVVSTCTPGLLTPQAAYETVLKSQGQKMLAPKELRRVSRSQAKLQFSHMTRFPLLFQCLDCVAWPQAEPDTHIYLVTTANAWKEKNRL